MEADNFERGRLVSGGAFCDGCEDYLEEGEHVYTMISSQHPPQEFLCCKKCRPADSDLPATIMSMEAALVVEDRIRDEDAAVYEVSEGAECRFCGHIFEVGEWVLVGVVEESRNDGIYCEECHISLILKGPGLLET